MHGMSLVNLNATQDGPLLVDVAILGPCPAIALQIEDPGELAVNTPWLPLGNTRLKQQTIRSKGWQVCLRQFACNIYTMYVIHAQSVCREHPPQITAQLPA